MCSLWTSRLGFALPSEKAKRWQHHEVSIYAVKRRFAQSIRLPDQLYSATIFSAAVSPMRYATACRCALQKTPQSVLWVFSAQRKTKRLQYTKTIKHTSPRTARRSYPPLSDSQYPRLWNRHRRMYPPRPPFPSSPCRMDATYWLLYLWHIAICVSCQLKVFFSSLLETRIARQRTKMSSSVSPLGPAAWRIVSLAIKGDFKNPSVSRTDSMAKRLSNGWIRKLGLMSGGSLGFEDRSFSSPVA